MKNQELLNFIQKLSLSQAYYMGKRDSWIEKLKEDLQGLPIDVGADDPVLKTDYYFIDLYNDRFAKEMGWA